MTSLSAIFIEHFDLDSYQARLLGGLGGCEVTLSKDGQRAKVTAPLREYDVALLACVELGLDVDPPPDIEGEPQTGPPNWGAPDGVGFDDSGLGIVHPTTIEIDGAEWKRYDLRDRTKSQFLVIVDATLPRHMFDLPVPDPDQHASIKAIVIAFDSSITDVVFAYRWPGFPEVLGVDYGPIDLQRAWSEWSTFSGLVFDFTAVPAALYGITEPPDLTFWGSVPPSSHTRRGAYFKDITPIVDPPPGTPDCRLNTTLGEVANAASITTDVDGYERLQIDLWRRESVKPFRLRLLNAESLISLTFRDTNNSGYEPAEVLVDGYVIDGVFQATITTVTGNNQERLIQVDPITASLTAIVDP